MGRDRTSELRGLEVGNIEECKKKKRDISRDEVSMCIQRVASITSLKAGIFKEDIFHGFG